MPSMISHGHSVITPGQVTEEMKTAWQSKEIPTKQRGLVQKELEAMYRNRPPKVYQILSDCLRYIMQPDGSILEIGCASGYYYEILEVHRCLRAKTVESDLWSHQNSLDLAWLMDKVREICGIRFPFET